LGQVPEKITAPAEVKATWFSQLLSFQDKGCTEPNDLPDKLLEDISKMSIGFPPFSAGLVPRRACPGVAFR
jgi:hypothetical protein